MRRHHTGSGRPTTAVIPADWPAHHAAVVDGTYESTVAIAAAGGTAIFNDTTGVTQVTGPAAVYTGAATISSAGGDRLVDVVGEVDATRIYEVKLPLPVAGVLPGMWVHVTTSPDPMLAGVSLSVNTVQRGGRRFSRVLLAILND